MKKIIALLLALIMCLSLCACANDAEPKTDGIDDEQDSVIDEDNDSDDDDDDTEKEDIAEKEDITSSKNAVLTLDSEYTVKDYISFRLIKVQTTDKISAPFGYTYYSSPEGKQYADVVIELTNIGATEIDVDEFATITAFGESGVEHTSSFFAIETSDDIDQYGTISPLSTARVHCALKVPLSETALGITLTIKENTYKLTYKINELISNAETLTVNQTIEDDNYAHLTFKGIEYTDDVLPSDTSGVYSHYAVDDDANTYLVVKFDITNYLATDKACDEFVAISAKYMNKYIYDGFAVVEDSDKKGFSSYDSIDPLSTRSLYYLIEIPKTVMENEVELTIYFNGTDYIFKG